jgi:hypothetical protein
MSIDAAGVPQPGSFLSNSSCDISLSASSFFARQLERELGVMDAPPKPRALREAEAAHGRAFSSFAMVATFARSMGESMASEYAGLT